VGGGGRAGGAGVSAAGGGYGIAGIGERERGGRRVRAWRVRVSGAGQGGKRGARGGGGAEGPPAVYWRHTVIHQAVAQTTHPATHITIHTQIPRTPTHTPLWRGWCVGPGGGGVLGRHRVGPHAIVHGRRQGGSDAGGVGRCRGGGGGGGGGGRGCPFQVRVRSVAGPL